MGADNRGIWTLDEAIEHFKRTAPIWESVRLEINDLIPIGPDHVVAPHTLHVRGREGIEVAARTTWLFTFRDGKMRRVCLYQEQGEAIAAAEAVGGDA